MTGSTRQPNWRKASGCGSATCVEVAKSGDQYLVRDSKNPAAVLSFSEAEWVAFVDAVVRDEFSF